MMIPTSARAVLIGLIALALLPVSAWGQAAERPVEAAEAGLTDFRISNVGPDGDVDFDALHPAVAYNDVNQEFLVVWAGDDRVDGDVEIYGQRLDAATGARQGRPIRISDMGPEGNPAFDAMTPAVVYNRAVGEYLVVWAGRDGADSPVAVFGQRLHAATGAEVGVNDFAISDAPARHPALAYNPAAGEYFVVWQGGTRAAGIFGQRLDAATGEALGIGAISISSDGLEDGPAVSARRPAVTYNGDRNEYLVVWEGDENPTAPVRGAFEIFGQRLAATGEVVGDDVRISTMGPDGDPAFAAAYPDVAYNDAGQEYLVVWIGDGGADGLVDNEFEVFGQRLDAATGEVVGDDVRISTMGPDGDPAFAAAYPDVAYHPDAEEYLVVWRGDDDAGSLVEGAHEIYGRRLAGDRLADAERTGAFRISDMGASDRDGSFDAVQAALAYGADDSYLAVWHGDDDDLATDNEHEIFGRRIPAHAALAVELKDFMAKTDSAGVMLKWATSRALSDARFEVQHKTSEAYDVVGTVEGPGLEDPQQYTYRVETLPPGRHTFRLKHVDAEGAATFSVEVEVLVEVPGSFLFTEAYPNPFNQSTTLTLTLKETQRVEVAVYDMLGRRTATLYQGMVEAYDAHAVTFEAGAYPSGAYFVRVVGETFADSRQVLLVR